MNLDELLGIEQTDSNTRRARALVEADRRLLDELVERRKELGLTQTEVARRMDISQSAVARIESGARDLHQSTVRRYAMAVDAMLEHRVIADDPARERSARIIGELNDQMQKSLHGRWDDVVVGRSVGGSWSATKRPART
ncbi:helix-turn-helix domain-containing protein [Nocardioides lianchengensis]|uniref:Helix-turn-helix n=1 Tax=Nocardioides lianchengensis TaxID=1045774 RepID=A0A1G6JSE6_9ACTN|nr:helix-turn-helix domain-containing protein [Nocardioides lianchengensis]NYG08764.1 transcriptional regulator with XRE-family HTH domain [Nocardioides lianchengensis]SDC21660.1 Helix-turn-helix [Nocardioides lianchengensis]